MTTESMRFHTNSGRRLQGQFKDSFKLVCLGLFICLALVSCEVHGQYEVARFDLGGGRSIEILVSRYLEVSQSVYYQVKVNNNIVVPLYRICGTIDKGQLRFNTISAKGGDLVAVFDERYPSEILAIHDFDEKISWPRGRDSNSPQANEKIGQRLLEQLQTEHTEMNFKFAGNDPCG